MNKPLFLFSLPLSLLLLPVSALAHGGEDHGEEAQAPPSSQGGSVATAVGSAFEVVLKAPPASPEEEVVVRFLLSEYETNTPVSEASLEVEAKGAGGFRATGKAKATKSPGIYELPLTFPEEGEYLFDLTIQTASQADLLTASGFLVKSPEVVSTGSSSFWSSRYAVPLGIGGILLSALFGFFLGRFVGGGRRLA